MIQAAVFTVSMLFPILLVAGMLGLAEWRDRRRAATLTRQVVLTDAITDELGAVVAPVVSHPLGGRWRVTMRLPMDRPAVSASALAIADATMRRLDAGRYELVLTPAAGAAAPAPAADAGRRIRHLRVA
ncbi:MAG TPA: hypothetical protein VFC42_03980 [Methylomirabilota bacterium]|jgi:hypothetical protein|nr:hypothetical protein [Methylomirabilota bacterium]